jgi:TPP-dependent 2-oxoacid decarboxylase
MKSTIGDFLIRRLKELGNDHIFGVPGDFNLQFLDQIEKADDIDFLGCCNELNASYAADGYSRIKGISTLLVTYGVGDLSALCGIAGAATEHVPMICIAGAPPLLSIHNRDLLHHTLAEGNYDDVMTCLTQFTAAQSRLMPTNAVSEIDRVLSICMQQKRPVYLQLPSDISHIGHGPPQLPDDNTDINQGNWGAIGHALPAVMGTYFAAPSRRHILFIGDGSLQLTVQELSTMLWHDQKPIIFVVNNKGYTIERYIYGMEAAYNDIANWKYKDLPTVFTDKDNYLSLSASTEAELEDVLKQAESSDKLVLVELHLDPFDAPKGLKSFGPAIANFDYGPLGPQRKA